MCADTNHVYLIILRAVSTQWLRYITQADYAFLTVIDFWYGDNAHRE